MVTEIQYSLRTRHYDPPVLPEWGQWHDFPSAVSPEWSPNWAGYDVRFRKNPAYVAPQPEMQVRCGSYVGNRVVWEEWGLYSGHTLQTSCMVEVRIKPEFEPGYFQMTTNVDGSPVVNGPIGYFTRSRPTLSRYVRVDVNERD